MNRGRIQAQENNLEESESWATINDVDKQDGLNKINLLRSKLTRKQLEDRLNAFKKLENFIQGAPADGHYAQVIKSFHHNPQNRRIRVDVEIRNGNAFNG